MYVFNAKKKKKYWIFEFFIFESILRSIAFVLILTFLFRFSILLLSGAKIKIPCGIEIFPKASIALSFSSILIRLEIAEKK